MTETELTVTVEDVSATYDHEGTIDRVDVRLSYETSYETNTGKRRVTYGAPTFRFDVVEGIARLESVDSRGHEREQETPDGALVSDLRALPAAADLVASVGDVVSVESFEETATEQLTGVDAVEFEPPSIQGD